jgi:hypothetical protein
MIRTLMKLGIERMSFNIIKVISNKPIANIILNGKKIVTISFKIKSETECPLPPHLFNSFGIPSQSNKTGRKNKGN